MSNPINSAPAPTEDQLAQWAALAGSDFPAAIIAGLGMLIDDPAWYGDEHLTPDFVLADDANFDGRPK